MAYGMKINRGDSAPKKTKVEQMKNYSPVTSMWKNIFTRAQSVDVTVTVAWTSMFTASDDISRMPICPAYRGSFLGTG